MAATGSRFVWHELNTSDPDGAMAFYKKVVGWGEQAWDQDKSYRMFTGGGVPMGGMNHDTEHDPMWLGYIAVPDVDATMHRALELGSKVLVPTMDLPNVGRFVVMADPQGVVFAPFTPAMGGGPNDEPGLLDWTWHELATTDGPSAWQFYKELFGWEEESQMDMGPAGVYLMFKRPGAMSPIGGIMTMSPEMKAMFKPDWLPYVRVKNVDTAAGLVKKHGGIVGMGPIDIPGGGRIVVCADPQGARFAMHSMMEDLKPAAPRTAPKKKAAKTTARKQGGSRRSEVARGKAKRPAVKKAAKKTAKKAAKQTSKRPAKAAKKMKKRK